MTAAWALAVVAALVGCAPPRPPHPAVAGYAAALHACVDASRTWSEYHACADRVEDRYSAIKAEDRRP